VIRQFFLISSFSETVEPDLVGYCFAGRDILIGREGYRLYRERNNTDIAPGLDGAYVVCNVVGNQITIGTDALGYQKLFYFKNGDAWAVSNSLYGLAIFLMQRGFSLTPYTPQLYSCLLQGPFGCQLTSFRTCFEEIRLLPAHMQIVVESVPASAQREQAEKFLMVASEYISPVVGGSNYHTLLLRSIKLCLGHIATLLRAHEFSVSCDLSGGIDSRTVFAFLQYALNNVEMTRRLSDVEINSDASKTHDLAAASNLANHFGFALNSGANPAPRRAIHFSHRIYYNYWKYTCLGVYAPIYFPSSLRKHPLNLHFRG
jgi:asparagine synthetase B (glutamine-hydrolysing)